MNKIKILFRLIKFLAAIFFISLFFGLGLFAYVAKDLPNPEELSQIRIIQSTKIYDRTGQILLYDIHGEEKRTIIPIKNIPDYIKQATIVIEDANFYQHHGLDFKAILRAFWANLKGQKITQGGSTITQQLIKNTFLTPEKTLRRKIKEAILSLELERRYSKDQILEFYLNQIPYGSNAYGIEAAAQTFFGKPAQELSLAEAALLAALPKAPSYYSPYGSHFKELKLRQEYILDRMEKFGYITKEQAEEAKKQELKFIPQKTTLKAPHFVMYIQEYLEEKYGREFIEKSGLKVYTTLDWKLQQLAEKLVKKYAQINEKKYRATNAALVALDPQTGQVLAMVGSRDYFDIKNQGNFNVAVSPHRQPGSSFKPFAYAVLFEKGYPIETILFDLETNFGKFGQKEYKPQNYDGKFRGPVSLRESLAQSINLTSVKVLYLAGLDETIKLAEKMGITTLKDRFRYGLSLVLGGGEVKLLEETAAYGVFATEGIKHPLSFILKITDSQGKILEEYQDNPKRIISTQTARQINDILSDEEARAPVFGRHSSLYLKNIPAAVKTGTTQEYSDGWTIGYTPNLVVGVWAGNNDYRKKMKPGSAGIYVAAPLWHEFMEKAYQIASKRKKEITSEFLLPWPPLKFTPPEKKSVEKPMLNGQFFWSKKVKIDRISGKLATESTPPELIEEKNYPQVHSILYYVDKDNPLGPFPEDPTTDPQFEKWEKPVLEWVEEKNKECQKLATTTCLIYNQSLPQEYDDIHLEKNKPEIKIIFPANNTIVTQSQITIITKTKSVFPIKQVDFFFDNQFVGSVFQSPFSFTFKLSSKIKNGPHSIQAKIYDTVLNRDEDQINIFIQRDTLSF